MIGLLFKVVAGAGAVVLFFWLIASPLGGGFGGKQKASGKVVAVVGLMGSGKSYWAVRTAWARLLAGGRVMTNFHMNFTQACKRKGCLHAEGDSTCVGVEMASRWEFFTGWEAIIGRTNVSVVIDEAQFYAPSNKTIAFPDECRWAMAMCRHFGNDYFLLTQDFSYLNGVIRLLTNAVFECHSMFGGRMFSVKAYPPKQMGNRKAMIQSQRYLLRRKFYSLYSTKEMVMVDGVHVGAGTKINEIARSLNDEHGIGAVAVREDRPAPAVAQAAPVSRAPQSSRPMIRPRNRLSATTVAGPIPQSEASGS
jgi:hypothetical protein